MGGQLTIWGASQILMSYFSKTVEAPPDLYLALIKTIAPTPYVSGSELDEPTNTDYARVAIPNDLDAWMNESQPQEVHNLEPVEFITAVSDWGEVRYWALCNAEVDGYSLLVGKLDTPVVVTNGDQVVIEEGDLSVALGPFFLVEED
jgi:hypothetical protein